MFILDSLMISGIRWALETALTAAEAEMNDDSVLREQLLETEMRRETGEISDEEFREIESDLLARMREIKERREGGSGPLAFGGQPMAAGVDDTFQVEATVSGDFHDPAAAPHTTVLTPLDEHHAMANLVSTTGGETIEVIDMEPGDAVPPPAPRPAAAGGSASLHPPHTDEMHTRAPQPARVGRVPQPSTALRPSRPPAHSRASGSSRARSSGGERRVAPSGVEGRAAAKRRSGPGTAARIQATSRSRRGKHS